MNFTLKKPDQRSAVVDFTVDMGSIFNLFNVEY
jgi:hypothetical protein